MTEIEKVSERLRAWLESTGETQQAIADRSGVARRTIQYFMKSGRASWDTLHKLSQAMASQNGKAA